MHVLMLTVDYPPDTRGGEGIYAGTIAPLLCQLGVKLEIVAPDGPGSRAYDAARNIPVHRIAVNGNNFVSRTLSFAWRSRDLVRQFRGDLIYSLRPIARPRQPLVSHFHATRRGQARAAMLTGQPIAALANAMFVPLECRHARHSSLVLVLDGRMRSELGCASSRGVRMEVLANGIDLAMFSPAAHQETQGARLLFVGRLDPLKGLADLIPAFARLRETVPHASLSIVGIGPMERALRYRVAALRLESSVHFLGHVLHEEMPAIYRTHDLVVLPSVYESFGLVTLEAMACGTAVLTSEVCARLGQPTFRPNDPDDLARMLLHAFSEREVLTHLRREGVRKALQHTWDATAKALLDHFETILPARHCQVID